MATFTVTSSSDDINDTGSLRYGLAHAQPNDTINFAAGITDIKLSQSLTISQNITILGDFDHNGTPDVTIDGQGAVTDFVITTGATARIDGLTITGGKGAGNTTGQSTAGAIYDSGNVYLTHTTVTNNTATGYDGYYGSEYRGGYAGGSAAGGIYVAGGATLHTAATDSFSGNTAHGGNGGGGGGGYKPVPFNGGTDIRYAQGGKGGQGGNAGHPGGYNGLAGDGSFAGSGGGAGQGGSNGRSFTTGFYDGDVPYSSYGVGPGGGGGGGNAFADYGGQGTTTADAEDPVCFATGTLIRTTRGDVAVEALTIGDVAVTASGAHRPIRWIGHRHIDCDGHPRRHEVRPIRIAAHAFGDNRPSRDLLVSPGHSICVDILGEVLIPAGSLTNGSTIRQETVDAVTYWHIELDSHDILLAENLACESYLDMGNRAFFQEADVVNFDANPDATSCTHADFCRPFVTSGPMLEVVRTQLRHRAETLGWTLQEDGLAGLHLVVDGVRIEPDVAELTVRFVVPATAKAAWLMSETARPSEVMGTSDTRDLGVPVCKLSIDDGLAVRRDIHADDERFGTGFHPCEAGSRRWTAGRADLPADLWAGTSGVFFLRLDLVEPALPRWVAPATLAGPRIEAAA